MPRDSKENMRGGKGTIEFTHIFNQAELLDKSRLCSKITINSGCSIGLHEHVNEEEIYYIIKGKGIIDDNGVKQEVCVGDAVLTGGGATHSIENASDEPLQLLAIILI